MQEEFINLTPDNIANEHLCCIIRSRKPHCGVEAKRSWLKERLKEGHVFRKLNAKAAVFIEYAPLEKAWVPICGENYHYIYCLWINDKAFRGKGYAKELMEYAINDVRQKGGSGLCMLGAKRQKTWLSDQSFAKKFGFEVVDSLDNGYELLALSFDGTKPHFAETVRKSEIGNQELTIFYDAQCPYIPQSLTPVRTYCETHDIPLILNHVNSLQEAKNLPCVFNNFDVFYKGKLETVNLLDIAQLKKILNK